MFDVECQNYIAFIPSMLPMFTNNFCLRINNFHCMLLIFDLILITFYGILIVTKDQICHAFTMRNKKAFVAIIITITNLLLYNITSLFSHRNKTKSRMNKGSNFITLCEEK